jgi:hypothetical protein
VLKEEGKAIASRIITEGYIERYGAYHSSCKSDAALAPSYRGSAGGGGKNDGLILIDLL